MQPLLHQPLTLQTAIRIDRAPAWLWIALQTAALWPTWRWMAARLVDGSDDPLGLLALAALGALLWSVRDQLRCAPRLPWLAAALVGTLAATLLRGPLVTVTPLVTSLLAVVAWVCGLLAFLPDSRCGAMRRQGVSCPAQQHAIAAAPVLALAVLALPLIASLQFYAGYPLRVITAEVSRWLLGIWFAVQREGSSLLVDGQLVIVDVPCSGVQMAWAGYFTACATALLKGRTNRAFLPRLPLVGLTVLAGNVLRNTVLVALEASGYGASAFAHQVVGLIVLAAVCASIAAVMAASKPVVQENLQLHEKLSRLPRHKWRGLHSARVQNRVLGKSLFGVAMLACALWAGAGGAGVRDAASASLAIDHATELPRQWQGVAVRPLALSAVEQRFAERFPGRIMRLTDGRQIVVLRDVTKPTRMLHPAADCYRALGYRIDGERLERTVAGEGASIQRCFTARKSSMALRVCEQIEDARGQHFADTSAWYWAATMGQSSGPWRAITVTQPLGADAGWQQDENPRQPHQ